MTKDIKNHLSDRPPAVPAVEVIQFHQTEISTDKRPQKQSMWGEGVQY